MYADGAFCARVRAAYESGADAAAGGANVGMSRRHKATACVVTLLYFLACLGGTPHHSGAKVSMFLPDRNRWGLSGLDKPIPFPDMMLGEERNAKT